MINGEINFKNDLNFGNHYADEAVNAWMKTNTIFSNARKNKQIKGIDYIVNFGNDICYLEMKSENYDDTKNMFVETFSDVQREKIGGPYRTVQEGQIINEHVLFGNYFTKNKILYIFYDVNKLCLIINNLIKTQKYSKNIIKNKCWDTEGYAIPLEKILKSLEYNEYERQDLTNFI